MRAWRQTWRGAAPVICGVLLAGLARATELRVERVGATSQGFLYVDYRLESPFEGKVLDAIRSGLPSTLIYDVEVWRQRSGWWDKLEETRESQLRLYRDLLNDQYVLASREEVRRFADLQTLTQAACEHRREYLRPLSPSKPCYVVITASLAPLSVDDLKELEEWLQGTIRGPKDDSRPGGIVGISGTMVGMLMSMSGFGRVSVHERTPTFTPDDVRLAPIVTRHAPPAPALPSQPRTPHALPDSARPAARSRP